MWLQHTKASNYSYPSIVSLCMSFLSKWHMAPSQHTPPCHSLSGRAERLRPKALPQNMVALAFLTYQQRLSLLVRGDTQLQHTKLYMQDGLLCQSYNFVIVVLIASYGNSEARLWRPPAWRFANPCAATRLRSACGGSTIVLSSTSKATEPQNN